MIFAIEYKGSSGNHHWYKAKEKYDVMVAVVRGERSACTCMAGTFEVPCKHLRKALELEKALEENRAQNKRAQKNH